MPPLHRIALGVKGRDLQECKRQLRQAGHGWGCCSGAKYLRNALFLSHPIPELGQIQGMLGPEQPFFFFFLRLCYSMHPACSLFILTMLCI